MSGDLWVLARNGTTLLPGEAKKLASAYDKLHEEVLYLRVLVGVEREVIEQLRQRITAAQVVVQAAIKYYEATVPDEPSAFEVDECYVELMGTVARFQGLQYDG